jgi:hypothetical protein
LSPLAGSARGLPPLPGSHRAEGRGWRDALVVVRRLDEAGPRIEAAFRRLGIPVRVAGGRRLADAPAARALRAALPVLGGAVEAGRFDPVGLWTWLRWWGHARDDAPFLAALDAREVAWRRHGFPADFATWRTKAREMARAARLLDVTRRRIAQAPGAAARLRALAAALDRLLPLPAAGGLDAEGRPRDPEADRRRGAAAEAREAVRGVLQGLATAEERLGLPRAASPGALVEAVVSALDRARFAPVDRRLDVVDVVDAEEARHWEAPTVFVAGLSEGSFPARPLEDPLLRDGERLRLHEADGALRLPLAREREVRERRLFYGALTRATERLVLVRPQADEDGAPRAPSPWWAEVERVVTPTPLEPPRPPGRPAPRFEEAVTARDLALAAAERHAAAGPEGDLARALLAAGDPTLRPRAAAWRRAEAGPLAWTDEVRGRFEAAAEVVSATALNAALACRHRHFLRAVVGVPEDDAPVDGARFSIRDQGALVHEALRLALAETGLSDEAVAERAMARAKGPTPTAAERALVLAEVFRIVRLFRAREAGLPGPLAPVLDGLEWRFGADGAFALAAGAGRLPLEGQVDRLDAADGRAVVIDYKLGTCGVDDAARGFEAGADVQLPLYALAVERARHLEVVGVEWVAATRRWRRGVWSDATAWSGGRREGVAPKALAQREFRRRLEGALERSVKVVRAVRAGDHAKQRDDAKTCAACAVRAVCRPAVLPFGPPEEGA